MDTQLGQLERVDLRQAWLTEDGDFTAWLTQEKNLVLLGDSLGLELELEGTEQGVGPFRADIVCKDTADGSRVVIENQLERTDHGHLGQLLTYAAGRGAVTLVWVARRFTEEHRAALDWLNENTGEHLSLFGVEIELWRIGNSLLAPKFNVVSRPNNWTKTRAGTAQGTGREPKNENQRMWLEYWTQFMELVRERNGVLKARKPPPQSTVSLAVGTSGFSVGPYAPARATHISACLGIGGSNRERAYKKLLKDHVAIEAELGEVLEWIPPNGKVSGFALLRLKGANWKDRDDWPNQHEWLLEETEKLHRVFAPRVKALARNLPR